MAVRIGTVTGRRIAKNRDGATNRLLLQVEVSNGDDIQTVEMRNAPGEDSNPPDGSQVLLIDVGAAFKLAIAADDGIAASMAEGEKKLYSINAGAIAAFINLLAGGNLELNGNADFAVRFNELETAFNQLKADHDALVAAHNAHAHSGVTVGGGTSGGITAAPEAPSTADISPAKVTTVKLP